MTAKCEAYQFTFIVYGEAEEEGGIETGFVVCVVQLKHMISTCDRIVSHCWCVWMEEGGGGKSVFNHSPSIERAQSVEQAISTSSLQLV